VATFAGNSKGECRNGKGKAASFASPCAIVARQKDGILFVLDEHRIRKITPDGEVLTFAGTESPGWADGPATLAAFRSPQGIAIDHRDGTLYVADTYNNRIRKISSDGLVSTFAGSGDRGFLDGPSELANFSNPHGVAVDQGDGSVYVADTSNHRIRRIIDGQVTTIVGTGSMGIVDGSAKVAELSSPNNILLDSHNHVAYVTDTKSIRKLFM